MIWFINILCENQGEEGARELQNNGRCSLCLPKQISLTTSNWILFADTGHPCSHVAAADSPRGQSALGVALQKTEVSSLREGREMDSAGWGGRQTSRPGIKSSIIQLPAPPPTHSNLNL